MRRLVTDEMVGRIGIVGTPEECAEQVAARFGEHADEVCCYFPGYDPGVEQIGELASSLRGG